MKNDQMMIHLLILWMISIFPNVVFSDTYEPDDTWGIIVIGDVYDFMIFSERFKLIQEWVLLGYYCIIGDVYDFMIFSERFKLIQECVEEKHKIIDVPITLIGIIGDVYDFMIFSERFKLIQECVEEKHKIIDVPITLPITLPSLLRSYTSLLRSKL